MRYSDSLLPAQRRAFERVELSCRFYHRSGAGAEAHTRGYVVDRDQGRATVLFDRCDAHRVVPGCVGCCAVPAIPVLLLRRC